MTKPPQRPFKIASVADMGANTTESGGNMRSISRLVAAGKVDWILHNGDISYADGYQGQWDAYFRDVQNITAYVPYMTTVGNHEVGVIGALGLAIGYIHRFQLPSAQATSSSLSNLYYSWNYGNVHFIAMDTESDLDIPLITLQQTTWLENDLATVDRKATPWIVVHGHRPFYCSGDKECDDNAFIFRRAIQLFHEYKVDLVLSGHRHNYERMWPIQPDGTPIKTYTNPGAPAYILNGVGGCREGFSGFGSVPFVGSAVQIKEWGYGILEFYNSTVMRHTLHKSDTDEVLDEIYLRVNH